MQRIMVDLPEPDGPHTTMRSPGATSRLMLRSTVRLAVPLVHVLHSNDQTCLYSRKYPVAGRGGRPAAKFACVARGGRFQRLAVFPDMKQTK